MKLRKTGGVVPRFRQILVGPNGELLGLGEDGRVWGFVEGTEENPNLQGWIECPKSELVEVKP